MAPPEPAPADPPLAPEIAPTLHASISSPTSQPSKAADEPTEPVASALSDEAAAPVEPHADLASSVWAKVLGSDVKRSLKTLITKLNPLSLTPGLAILEVPADLIEIARTNQRELELLIASITGKRTTIEFREQGVTRTATKEPLPGFSEAAPPAAAITDHPVVKRAAELFNARVVSVQPRRRPANPAPAAPVPSPAVQESGAQTETDTGDSD